MQTFLLLITAATLGAAAPAMLQCGGTETMTLLGDANCRSFASASTGAVAGEHYDSNVCDCVFFSGDQCAGDLITGNMAVIHNTANSYVCFPKAKTDSTSELDARDNDADNVCPFVRDDSKSPITLFGPNNELLTTSSPQGPMSGHMVLCLEKNFKGYCAITNHLNMCANFPDKYFHKTSSIFQIEGEGDIVQCFYYETANCKGKNAFGGVDSTYFRMQARDLKRWDKKLGSAGCQKDLGPPSPLIEQNWDREASLRRGFWRRED